MGLEQLNYAGLNKVEVAIARIQQFEPPEGYYLASSYGKDSVTIIDLSLKARAKHDIHYNRTTCDPPELVQFIKSFPDVIIESPPKTMWQLVEERGLPRRQSRYCCEELKERGGSGRVVMTGIRRSESKGHTRRAHRQMVETCYKDTSKRFVNPIIDWDDNEVWEYIRLNNVKYCSLYDEGAGRKGYGEGDFKRLGCVLCPMVRDIKRQFLRWPKICDAWYRATVRYWQRQTKGGEKFTSPDALFDWWLHRDRNSQPDEQLQFYD